jgi:hypothetical protein
LRRRLPPSRKGVPSIRSRQIKPGETTMVKKHHDENKDKVGKKNMGSSGNSDRKQDANKEKQKENREKKEAAAAAKKGKK